MTGIGPLHTFQPGSLIRRVSDGSIAMVHGRTAVRMGPDARYHRQVHALGGRVPEWWEEDCEVEAHDPREVMRELVRVTEAFKKSRRMLAATVFKYVGVGRAMRLDETDFASSEELFLDGGNVPHGVEVTLCRRDPRNR